MTTYDEAEDGRAAAERELKAKKNRADAAERELRAASNRADAAEQELARLRLYLAGR